MCTLIINAGSSSIKVALFSDDKRLFSYKLDFHKKPFKLTFENKETKLKATSKSQAIIELLRFIKEKQISHEINSIGHRIVHGKDYFHKPTLINEQSLNKIKKCSELAPLHNPLEINCIKEAKKLWPKAKQYAHFDTAFFTHLSQVHKLYPLPKKFEQLGVKRYGFHGINHQYCYQTFKKLLPKAKNKKIIIAHLGNGCSLSAIKGGKCIDTTMGFTPLEGLMMGTRPGSIDPGIIFYLIRQKHYTAKELESIFNHDCGLLGLSHLSSDVQELIKSKSQRAKLAIEMFTISIAKHISQMAVSLKGCDHLIFTGGIGENSALIRRKVLHQIKPLLDLSTNKTNQSVWVIKADEERAIYHAGK